MTAAPKGPLWTRARLMRVLTLRYGLNRLGHVDTVAAAQGMGVSPRTMQRWLAGRSGRQVAHLPPRRREQLVELLTPSAERVRDEHREGDYARRAIEQVQRLDGVLPAWKERGWLEPHQVLLLAIRPQGIRQIAVNRLSASRSETLRRRGAVLSTLVVPTRFHATAVVRQVLHDVQPWRFQASPSQARQGMTQCWLDDAPPVDLAEVLARLDLPEAATP